MVILQPDTFRSESIEMWCFQPRISMTTHIAITLVVSDDQDYIWAISQRVRRINA